MTGYAPKETRIGADGGVDIWVYKPGIEKAIGIVQCKALRSYKVGAAPGVAGGNGERKGCPG